MLIKADIPISTSLKVETQVDRIDVLALINDENEANSYCKMPFSEWKDNWVRYQGFYLEY